MRTSIDVKFIFDSARLGLFISANILQIADVALQVVFLFSIFLHVFSYYFAQSLLLKGVQCPPFLLPTDNQNNSTSSKVFSVNGALTCKKAALLTLSVH